jgi:hypothetical protein
MYLRLKLDGRVDFERLKRDVEFFREYTVFPPFELTLIEDGSVGVLVDSPTMTEAEARKLMSDALWMQERTSEDS